MKAILLLLGFCSWAVNSGIILNEIQPNPAGSDPAIQWLELRGEANSDYANLSLVALEADLNSNLATIDSQTVFTDGKFDEQGLALLDVPNLENPSFILVLLQDWKFADGADLDVNDDGVFDDDNWFSHVVDAVGVYDSKADYQQGLSYTSQLAGQSISYTGDEPQLIFRESDSFDWFAVNDPIGSLLYKANGDAMELTQFDSTSFITFGYQNPSIINSVSEPSYSILMLLLAGLLVISRKGRLLSNFSPVVGKDWKLAA